MADEPDYLGIPPFLDLSIPANLERWKQARRDWRPSGKLARASAEKINRDSAGNPLPRGMDESSWAFLRALERQKSADAKNEKAAKDEAKMIERNAKAAVKAAVKAAASNPQKTLA